MSARIDSARAAALVRRPIFYRKLEVVAYEVVLGAGPITDIGIADIDGDGLRLTLTSVAELDLTELSAGKPVHLAAPGCDR